MDGNAGTAIDVFRKAALAFGRNCPDSIRVLERGHRLMEEGQVSDDCYLIQEGSVSILVRDPKTGREKQVALRFAGDLIGETAFFQRRDRRTASVMIVSETAVLIRLTRENIFELLRGDQAVNEAVLRLWELAANRRSETEHILAGDIYIENRIMSAVVADIHNFSTLGEAAWEEQSDAFLFDFLEESQIIAERMNGSFEDQGDGFKIIFSGVDHVDRCTSCAVELKDNFIRLRSQWILRNQAFSDIGLGIGICTDCMSIRKRTGCVNKSGRILSHSINIAAAMSKLKVNHNEVEIYLDETTASMMRSPGLRAEPLQQKWLEKLGRVVPVRKLVKLIPPSVSDQPRPDKEFIPSIPGEERIIVLFLASDPSDEARLRSGEEAREIEQKLRTSRFRDKFVFHQRHSVRPEDLSQVLLDLEPHIVHFSGHGVKGKGLCFESVEGKSLLVSPQALSALFGEFLTVRCVVLNSCYSELQAEAICRHVAYVVGMSDAISDRAAIAFGIGFYQALGAGKCIDDAFRFGRVQIGLQSAEGNESILPILRVKQSYGG